MGQFIHIDSVDSQKQKIGPNPGEKPQSVFIQFVPGVVMDVVCNDKCTAYTEASDINSIIAKKHIGGNTNYKSTERNRYYPLFRGIVDTPVKGDSVLLLDNMAGQNYYIGPLNSTNSPNFNVDPLNITLNQPEGSNNTSDISKPSFRDKFNIPLNFPISPVARLGKSPNKILDDPDGKRKGEDGSIAKEEPYGDMLFEGRFGNSIRVGSRSSNPLITISNGRNAGMPSETLNDGSIISITSAGSLIDHFHNFVLSSDGIDNNNRLVAGGNDDEESSVFDYNYGNDGERPVIANQIFIRSDRIVFDSVKNNITLSAFNNIDMGSGNNLTINTKNFMSLESSNIYLGEQAQERNEPLVLGTQLKEFLKEFLNTMKRATALVQGTPIPLYDERGINGEPLLDHIDDLLYKLDNPKFLSQYHYIEDNGQKAE